MFWQFIVSILLFAVFVQSEEEPREADRCLTNVTGQSDFKKEKFLGRWYENAKYPLFSELNVKCKTFDYGDLGNDDFSVTLTQYGRISGLKSSFKGAIKQVEPAKFSIQFPFAPVNGVSSSHYWVLDTDYDNYAVIYTCFGSFLIDARVVWILTRDRNPSTDVVNRAKQAMLKKGLSLNPLIVTDQKNCPEEEE